VRAASRNINTYRERGAAHVARGGRWMHQERPGLGKGKKNARLYKPAPARALSRARCWVPCCALLCVILSPFKNKRKRTKMKYEIYAKTHAHARAEIAGGARQIL
jgi:hypothetical protein